MKRKRDADIEHLRSSALYKRNPARLNLLLGTLRIINNNLPLRMREYEETRLKKALVVRVEMCTSLNAKCIKNAIIELYVPMQKERIEFLDINSQPYPSFIMVADFRT